MKTRKDGQPDRRTVDEPLSVAERSRRYRARMNEQQRSDYSKKSYARYKRRKWTGPTREAAELLIARGLDAERIASEVGVSVGMVENLIRSMAA